MSEDWRIEGQHFATFLEAMSPEERAKANADSLFQTEAIHQDFSAAFAKGSCFVCGKPLKCFSAENPCPHWLLKPKGFKKKHMQAVGEKFGIFQLQSYLRWVANEQASAKNINDLPVEGSGDKLVEVTIRYHNLEWSFSCAESDYLGHQTTQYAKHPHYHFQMRVDQRPFINYNDFHLPLTKMDVVHIEALRSAPETVKARFHFGEGMADILSDETIEDLVRMSGGEASEGDAPLHFDSIAMAEEGKTIRGEDLYEIIQEAKAKGVTVASLMHKLPNATTRVIVSPGPGVVEQAPRSGGRKGA